MKDSTRADKIVSVVTASVLITLLIGMGLLSTFLPKPTESLVEKRELATMPEFSAKSLFLGEFNSRFELFYADTFPAREVFVSLASTIETLRGFSPDGVRIHEAATTPPPTPQPEDGTPPAVTDTDVPADGNNAPTVDIPPSQSQEMDGEQRGSVFLMGDTALPLFSTNVYACQRYADVLNGYQQALGDSVKIYNLVIPSAIEFYIPEKYRSVSADEVANIEYIYSLMDKNITTVDAYTPMNERKNEYLYFRTDHHWTARGAHAAYTAFAKDAGFEPVPLEEMRYGRIDNFVGSLYGQTQEPKLAKNPDFVEYFVPPTPHVAYQYVRNSPYKANVTTAFAEYASGQNSYSVFLAGDYPLTHIQTENKNGKNIAVVKESFGNAFSPFLISHYENIYVIDQRYFQLGFIDFIQKNNIQELLFINNIYAANTDIRINEIKRMMYQTYVPYVPPAPKPVPVPEPEPEPTPPPEPEPEKPPEGFHRKEPDDNVTVLN